jgi:hypothetical protein
MSHKSKNKRGFIALISAIIISALLLTITLGLGFSGFFSRFNIFDSESKERSLALAEACVNMAILKLATDKDYAVTVADHAILVNDTETCSIVSLSPPPTRTFPITIRTNAIMNKAHTNLEVVIDSNYKITSWQEIPNL